VPILRLTDFGFAIPLAHQKRQLGWVGTSAYWPPEAGTSSVDMESADPAYARSNTREADIWALGACLQFAATGRGNVGFPSSNSSSSSSSSRGEGRSSAGGSGERCRRVKGGSGSGRGNEDWKRSAERVVWDLTDARQVREGLEGQGWDDDTDGEVGVYSAAFDRAVRWAMDTDPQKRLKASELRRRVGPAAAAAAVAVANREEF
jgi:serine/threonine protein kinase